MFWPGAKLRLSKLFQKEIHVAVGNGVQMHLPPSRLPVNICTQRNLEGADQQSQGTLGKLCLEPADLLSNGFFDGTRVSLPKLADRKIPTG